MANWKGPLRVAGFDEGIMSKNQFDGCKQWFVPLRLFNGALCFDVVWKRRMTTNFPRWSQPKGSNRTGCGSLAGTCCPTVKFGRFLPWEVLTSLLYMMILVDSKWDIRKLILLECTQGACHEWVSVCRRGASFVWCQNASHSPARRESSMPPITSKIL